MDSRSGRLGFLRMLIAVSVVLVLVLVLAAEVAEGAQPLDGLVFSGQFGDDGKPPDRKDTLHFADGMFWSDNCVPCGFPPSPYWVRETRDGIQFRGVLQSKERGTFTYQGVFDGDVLTVDINWKRVRWYRTIDRNFWFRGEPASGIASGAPQSAATVAASASDNPPQGLDCSP